MCVIQNLLLTGVKVQLATALPVMFIKFSNYDGDKYLNSSLMTFLIIEMCDLFNGVTHN